MFGQSLLSAFGIACTTDTDQLFTTPTSTTSLATYQLNNATTSIPNNTYPGTPSNITYTTGKFGDAAVFNGSNSQISLGSANNFASNKLTISFWHKPTATPSPSYKVLFSTYGSSFGDGFFNVVRLANNKIDIGIYAGSGYFYRISDSAVFSNNVWKNIVMVIDNTKSSNADKFTLYVDNTVVSTSDNGSSGTPSGNMLNTSNNLLIGNWAHSSGYNDPAVYDQIRIFNTALPQAAITALYNETTTTAQSASVDYQAANPNSIAYYKMSSATDQLGNYNGTATDVNFNTEGKFGFAGAFNGSSSVINLGTSSSFSVGTTGSLSLSLWVKTTATSTGYLMSKANDSTTQYEWALEYNGSQLQLNVFNTAQGVACGSGYNTTNINDGNWHHVSGVIINNTSVSLYIDNGNPITSTSWSGTTAGPFTIPTLIGHFGGIPASTSYWEGDVDQVRVYDSALSASNISTLYKEVECEPAAINALANFNTVTYDGTGGSQSTNSLSNQVGTLGFAPGMTWIKSRSNATWHEVHDVVRGNLPRIFPNDPYQELTSANGFASFDSNGFSLDAAGSGGDVNTSGRTYVAWNWKAALANLSTSFNGSSTVGSASRIDLTGSTTLTTRSISLWVNLAGTGSGGNLILDNSDGQNPGVVQYGKWVIQLQYGGTNYFAWDTYNGSSYGICDVNYTFNLNTWYHIVFVVEAQNQAVYINGVSQTLQGVSRPGDIGTVTMSTNRLGASWSTQYTHALNGTMGQVRIFNDALTASEVADLYAEPAASNNTLNYPAGAGCIAAYPLQTDAVDLSGNYSGASSNVTFGQPGYLTSNTDGAIPSTVAVNDAAGFSVVKYTATGTTATVGHGLSSAPELILSKTTSAAYDWLVYAAPVGATKQMQLDSSAAASTSGFMNNTAPTSSVYTVASGNNLNYANGDVNVAYCFTSIPGYSKIGSYVGNGSSQTLYTGFAVKFVLIKSTTSSQNWMMYDSTRGGNKYLIADLAGAEGTSGSNLVTFNSNGFSVSNSNSENQSGQTFIFLAIA